MFSGRCFPKGPHRASPACPVAPACYLRATPVAMGAWPLSARPGSQSAAEGRLGSRPALPRSDQVDRFLLMSASLCPCSTSIDDYKPFLERAVSKKGGSIFSLCLALSQVPTRDAINRLDDVSRYFCVCKSGAKCVFSTIGNQHSGRETLIPLLDMVEMVSVYLVYPYLCADSGRLA